MSNGDDSQRSVHTEDQGDRLKCEVHLKLLCAEADVLDVFAVSRDGLVSTQFQLSKSSNYSEEELQSILNEKGDSISATEAAYLIEERVFLQANATIPEASVFDPGKGAHRQPVPTGDRDNHLYVDIRLDEPEDIALYVLTSCTATKAHGAPICYYSEISTKRLFRAGALTTGVQRVPLALPTQDQLAILQNICQNLPATLKKPNIPNIKAGAQQPKGRVIASISVEQPIVSLESLVSVLPPPPLIEEIREPSPGEPEPRSFVALKNAVLAFDDVFMQAHSGAVASRILMARGQYAELQKAVSASARDLARQLILEPDPLSGPGMGHNTVQRLLLAQVRNVMDWRHASFMKQPDPPPRPPELTPLERALQTLQENPEDLDSWIDITISALLTDNPILDTAMQAIGGLLARDECDAPSFTQSDERSMCFDRLVEKAAELPSDQRLSLCHALKSHFAVSHEVDIQGQHNLSLGAASRRLKTCDVPYYQPHSLVHLHCMAARSALAMKDTTRAQGEIAPIILPQGSSELSYSVWATRLCIQAASGESFLSEAEEFFELVRRDPVLNDEQRAGFLNDRELLRMCGEAAVSTCSQPLVPHLQSLSRLPPAELNVAPLEDAANRLSQSRDGVDSPFSIMAEAMLRSGDLNGAEKAAQASLIQTNGKGQFAAQALLVLAALKALKGDGQGVRTCVSLAMREGTESPLVADVAELSLLTCGEETTQALVLAPNNNPSVRARLLWLEVLLAAQHYEFTEVLAIIQTLIAHCQATSVAPPREIMILQASAMASLDITPPTLNL